MTRTEKRRRRFRTDARPLKCIVAKFLDMIEDDKLPTEFFRPLERLGAAVVARTGSGRPHPGNASASSSKSRVRSVCRSTSCFVVSPAQLQFSDLIVPIPDITWKRWRRTRS
jgi:hypothetical protein